MSGRSPMCRDDECAPPDVMSSRRCDSSSQACVVTWMSPRIRTHQCHAHGDSGDCVRTHIVARRVPLQAFRTRTDEHVLRQRLMILRLSRCSKLPTSASRGDCKGVRRDGNIRRQDEAPFPAVARSAVRADRRCNDPRRQRRVRRWPPLRTRAPTLVRLEPDPFVSHDALTDAMNACVDGIVAREFAKAGTSCDLAVKIARTERGGPGSSAMSSPEPTFGRRAAGGSGLESRRAQMDDGGRELCAGPRARQGTRAADLDFVQANLAVMGSEANPAVSVVAR